MKADGCIRHSVGAVENRRLNLSSRIGGPRIQFAARYADQTTVHVEPDTLAIP